MGSLRLSPPVFEVWVDMSELRQCKRKSAVAAPTPEMGALRLVLAELEQELSVTDASPIDDIDKVSD